MNFVSQKGFYGAARVYALFLRRPKTMKMLPTAIIINQGSNVMIHQVPERIDTGRVWALYVSVYICGKIHYLSLKVITK
jgi:drug/metabolite transporter superfamily protein YnfA